MANLTTLLITLLIFTYLEPQVYGLTPSNVLTKLKNPIKIGREKLLERYDEYEILNGSDITREQQNDEKEYYDGFHIPNIYFYKERIYKYDLFNTSKDLNEKEYLLNDWEFEDLEIKYKQTQTCKNILKKYGHFTVQINGEPVTISCKNSIRKRYFYNSTENYNETKHLLDNSNNTWQQSSTEIVRKLLKLNNTNDDTYKEDYETNSGLKFVKEFLDINNNIVKASAVPYHDIDKIIFIKKQYWITNKFKKLRTFLRENDGKIFFGAFITLLHILSCMASF